MKNNGDTFLEGVEYALEAACRIVSSRELDPPRLLRAFRDVFESCKNLAAETAVPPTTTAMASAEGVGRGPSECSTSSPDDARTMKLLNLYAAAVPPFNGPDREHLRVRPQFMRDLLDYIGRCNDELAACRSEANGRLVDNLRVSPWCSEGPPRRARQPAPEPSVSARQHLQDVVDAYVDRFDTSRGLIGPIDTEVSAARDFLREIAGETP